MGEWIFIKFSGYDKRHNLEHFGDDPLNPLDTGAIFFLFSGSVFINNII